jgi:hypothetical protein
VVDQTGGYAAGVTGSTIHNFRSYLNRERACPLRRPSALRIVPPDVRSSPAGLLTPQPSTGANFRGQCCECEHVHRLERAHWVTLAQVGPAAVDQGHVGCHTCGVHEGSVLHAIGMDLLTR